MAHPVDIFVGKKIKSRRSLLGLSQNSLGQEIGVTFQQVQKYERGVNRVSCSRLYDFSKVLKVPITFFFEGFQADNEDKRFSFAENDSNSNFVKEDVFESKETSTLLREYYKITDASKRKHILEIIKAMSAN
jgi:transcriptional regulator with XRE-family HTH domain